MTDKEWDGDDRRKERTQGVAQLSRLVERLGTTVEELLAETSALREELRTNKIVVRLLALLIALVLAGLGGGVLTYQDSRQRDEVQRVAALERSCKILNKGIERDARSNINLAASSVKPGSSNFPTTEAARQKLQQQIDAFLAGQSLDLIDCKAYVQDPEHEKYVKGSALKFTVPSLAELQKIAEQAKRGQ